MGRTKKVLENAILGIDIGSTSSRLFLLTASGREIVIESGPLGDYTRYEPGDFSTSCYPFDEGQAYIGNELDHGRLATSLKPVFLLLSAIDTAELKPLISEYPHAEYLRTLMHGRSTQHRRFRQKLKAAIASFFHFLRDRTIKTCNSDGLCITSVGISVPAQWPAAVEDYMADVFRKKFLCGSVHFKVPEDGIFFHSETQALAHYLFRHHAADLLVTKSREKIFLLADFGGQNLNVSTYQVQAGKGGGRAFFEMDKSIGTIPSPLRNSVVGGSEQQDYHIGRHCEGILELQKRSLSRAHKQHLINEFHSLKKKLDSGHNAPEHLRMLNCGDIHIKLTPRVIGRAFDKAMTEPLQKLRDVLESNISSNGHSGPLVIVSGGTARSPALQDKLAALCNECNLDPPVFTDKMELTGRYPSLNVAKGAAYATGNILTVEEFIGRGAAIGAQLREQGETAWNNTAPILCYVKDEFQRTLEVREGEEIKLICDPFLRKTQKTHSIDYRRAYDIYTVGAFKKGQIQVKASFYPSGHDLENPTLLFSLMWRPELPRRPHSSDWLHGSLTLPLTFHRSSSCVLVVQEEVKNNLPLQALMGSDASQTDTTAVEDNEEHGPVRSIAPVANMEPGSPAPGTRGPSTDEAGDSSAAVRQSRITGQGGGITRVYSEPWFEVDTNPWYCR